MALLKNLMQQIGFYLWFIYYIIIYFLFCLARNDIQHAAVQYVLDSVVLALDENPDRRFIYVEIGFFWRWWLQQTDDIRNKVAGFVNDGKILQITLYLLSVFLNRSSRVYFWWLVYE